MDIEVLFANIKARCDAHRLIATGTGKPVTYSIYQDHVQFRFTIGLAAWLGCEVFTIDESSPAILDKFMQDRILMPTDVIADSDYDEINVLLSGTLAAVYGKAVPLKRLIGNYYK